MLANGRAYMGTYQHNVKDILKESLHIFSVEIFLCEIIGLWSLRDRLMIIKKKLKEIDF